MNEITKYKTNDNGTLIATCYESSFSSKEIRIIPLLSTGSALLTIFSNQDDEWCHQKVCKSVRAAKLYAKNYLKQ